MDMGTETNGLVGQCKLDAAGWRKTGKSGKPCTVEAQAVQLQCKTDYAAFPFTKQNASSLP